MGIGKSDIFTHNLCQKIKKKQISERKFFLSKNRSIMGVRNSKFYADIRSEEIIFRKCTEKELHPKKKHFFLGLTLRSQIFFRKNYFLGFSIFRYIFPNNFFRSEFSMILWIFYTHIDLFRKEKISLLERTYKNFGNENMKSALQRLKRKKYLVFWS